MAIPVHHCADLERALAFYVNTLGAKLLWRDRDEPGPCFAAVRWRDHDLYLSSHAGDGVAGAATYLPVADVDEVYAELRARGYQPRTDRGPVHASPVDQTWGMRELYVLDPDGNCLRFSAPADPAVAAISRDSL
jgi:catechol 2,3-dioxygenase-like lactoylglutathione lyase family enzyme